HEPDRVALALLDAQAGYLSTADPVELRRALLRILTALDGSRSASSAATVESMTLSLLRRPGKRAVSRCGSRFCNPGRSSMCATWRCFVLYSALRRVLT